MIKSVYWNDKINLPNFSLNFLRSANILCKKLANSHIFIVATLSNSLYFFNENFEFLNKSFIFYNYSQITHVFL